MNHPIPYIHWRRAGCALLILATALVSCGRDRFVHRWNDDVLAVGKLQDGGELDRAEARYEELLENAPDDDARRYVLNELGRIAEERADWEQALERYRRVWREPRDDEAGARALYRSAVIWSRHLGDAERGLKLRRRTIERFPKSVSAEFSARDIAAHYRERADFAAMRADFDALYRVIEGTAVADNVLFAAARTLEEDAGEEFDALLYYRKLFTTYPDGGLADDALWQAAMIYHRQQNWSESIHLLERLADDVETSWFVGSYNSPWTNDARFTLGTIHLLHLGDYEQAITHFERYLQDFPYSLEADDAAWNIVEARRLSGDAERYQEAMEVFVEDYPESRFVREVERRRPGRAARDQDRRGAR